MKKFLFSSLTLALLLSVFAFKKESHPGSKAVSPTVPSANKHTKPQTKIPPALLRNEGNAHVNGGGTAMEGGKKSTFVFNAVEQHDGTVNGHLVYNYRAGDNQIDMDVTCLSISGNRATLAGTVTSATGNVPWFITVGGIASFTVQDNGNGKGDEISNLVFGVNGFVSSCADDWPTYLVMSGNITIKQ